MILNYQIAFAGVPVREAFVTQRMQDKRSWYRLSKAIFSGAAGSARMPG